MNSAPQAVIRVLVVDDSALMRAMLSEIINAASDLKVIGTAVDAAQAADAIRALRPDVLTLDVEMPGVNGLDFLERLMRERPLPVVMISSHTERGSETTLRALELGAVDFITKPRNSIFGGMSTYGEEVREKIRGARGAHPHVPPRANLAASATAVASSPPARLGRLDPRVLREKIVFIGASTGGTEAIRDVLVRFPAEMPPILIVQHMPEMFTGSFARRLDNLSALHVKEAEHGEPVKPGVAYLAPGHSHLMLKRGPGGFACELSKADPVNRHRPSVDVLFHSAARVAGAQAIGVILTGMGKDGAQGMLAMRQAGAWNIAQDQASSVVWGMPREATMNGAVQDTAPLQDIAAQVLNRLRAPERSTNVADL